ncbi:hypothetical protein [Pseudoalteromonas distincta]|uniref:hypothetical protein n=1 Tax=Pseudoalteromonas distincta TaxID=77608 RepID=UPI0034E86142
MISTKTIVLAPSSPEIFPMSCSLHDNCYDSGTAKSVCDLSFQLNMFTEARFLARNDMELYSSLFVARIGYYEAVTHADKAFEAYCNATPNPADHAVCLPNLSDYLNDNLEHNDDTNGGTLIGGTHDGYVGGLQTGNYGQHYYSYSCELWRFPDGKGSYYLMQRNCTFM